MPAWSSIWDSVRHGNFSDAGNYLFLSQDDVNTSNKADSQLEDLNRQRLGEGKITKDEFDRRTSEVQQNAFPFIFENPEMSPLIGFQDGFVEQAQKEINFVKKTTQGIADTLFSVIPWQVYVIGAIVGIIYLINIGIIPIKKTKI